MLPKFMSPFKAEQEEEAMKKMKKKKKKQNNSRRSCQTSMDVIGLRLVTHITNSQTKSHNSNVVVKSAILRIGNNINATTNTSNLEIMCFLKNCSLCNKKLHHDQDIYMYRGDQGFCSIECRNRQIAMDEVKELEESTKQRAKSSFHSYRNCWNDARRHETRLILEDLRLHRLQSKPIPSDHPQNHWAIVS